MIRALLLSFLDLIYPKQCLNCSTRLDDQLHLLCSPCIDLMIVTDPEEHCRKCYSLLDNDTCNRCLRSTSPFFRSVAVFSESESAFTLAKRLEELNGAFLADSLASFLAVQMDRQSLPSLDFLVPASDEGSKRLAKALSKILDIELLDAIIPASLFRIEGQLRKECEKKLTEKHVGFVSLGTIGFSRETKEGHLLLECLPRSLNGLFFLRHLQL